MRPPTSTRSPDHEMDRIEDRVQGMKRDAQQLGKQVADRSEREQSEVLQNLKGHMEDIGRVRDISRVIEKPFWRGTKF